MSPDRRQADPGDLGQAQACAEQDDPEPQDALGGEARDPASRRPRRGPAIAATTMPEEEGDRDLGDDRRQETGDEPGDERDGDRRREPGPIDRAPFAIADGGDQDGASLGVSLGGSRSDDAAARGLVVRPRT